MRSLFDPLFGPLTGPILSLSISGTQGGGPDGIAFVGTNFTNLEFAWGQPQLDTLIAFAKAKGVTVVRIPTAWERWQPTLNGALNSAYVAVVRDLIARLHAEGIASIIDLHNNGRYDPDLDPPEGSPPGTYLHGAAGMHANSHVLGSAELPVSALVNVWTRIMTEFVGEPGLVGVEPMNEPHDLVSANLINNGNLFEGANWFYTSSSDGTPDYAANPYGTANDAWLVNAGSGFGGAHRAITLETKQYTIAIWARSVSGTQAFKLGYDFSSDSGNLNATTTWQKFEWTFNATAGSRNLNFQVQGGSGTQVVFFMGQLNAGAASLEIGPSSTWYTAAQQCCEAIWAIDPDMVVLLDGDNYAIAERWVEDNDNLKHLPDPNGKMRFAASWYLDENSPYDDGWDVGLTPTTGQDQVAGFIGWLGTNSLKGVIRETGIPANHAAALVAWENGIDTLQAAGIPIVYWTFGQKQGGDPSFYLTANNPKVLIRPEDSDQGRPNLLMSKAKAGPFVWP